MATEQQTSIERAASILAETSKQLDTVDAMIANPGKDSWPARFRLLNLPRATAQEVAYFVKAANRVYRLQQRLATRIRPGLERRISEVALWYETEKGVAAIKESVERGAQKGEVGLTPDILKLAEDGIRPLRERLGKIREVRVPSRPTGATGEHTRLPYPAEPTSIRPTVPIVTPEPEAVIAKYPEIIIQGKRRAVIVSETLTIPDMQPLNANLLMRLLQSPDRALATTDWAQRGWPEVSTAVARNRLHTALRKIRTDCDTQKAGIVSIYVGKNQDEIQTFKTPEEMVEWNKQLQESKAKPTRKRRPRTKPPKPKKAPPEKQKLTPAIQPQEKFSEAGEKR